MTYWRIWLPWRILWISVLCLGALVAAVAALASTGKDFTINREAGTRKFVMLRAHNKECLIGFLDASVRDKDSEHYLFVSTSGVDIGFKDKDSIPSKSVKIDCAAFKADSMDECWLVRYDDEFVKDE